MKTVRERAEELGADDPVCVCDVLPHGSDCPMGSGRKTYTRAERVLRELVEEIVVGVRGPEKEWVRKTFLAPRSPEEVVLDAMVGPFIPRDKVTGHERGVSEKIVKALREEGMLKG